MLRLLRTRNVSIWRMINGLKFQFKIEEKSIGSHAKDSYNNSESIMLQKNFLSPLKIKVKFKKSRVIKPIKKSIFAKNKKENSTKDQIKKAKDTFSRKFN